MHNIMPQVRWRRRQRRARGAPRAPRRRHAGEPPVPRSQGRAETKPKQAVFEDALRRLAKSAFHQCQGPVRNKAETRPKQSRNILLCLKVLNVFHIYSFWPSFTGQGRNKAETRPKQTVFE